MPSSWQVSHLILYPVPFLSQFPPPDVQGKQSGLWHPLFLRGSALAIDLTDLPARSMTGILQPVTYWNFLQTSFISLVISPEVGSSSSGADTGRVQHRVHLAE